MSACPTTPRPTCPTPGLSISPTKTPSPCSAYSASTPATAAATTDDTTTHETGDDGSTDTDAEQVPITYDVARAIVWAALQADQKLAVRELIDLTDHIGIDVLMLSSDRMRNVNDLWTRAIEELREVGNRRPDTVRDWLDGAIQQADDLRSGVKDADEGGPTTKRRSAGGLRCPVPELEE